VNRNVLLSNLAGTTQDAQMLLIWWIHPQRKYETRLPSREWLPMPYLPIIWIYWSVIVWGHSSKFRCSALVWRGYCKTLNFGS